MPHFAPIRSFAQHVSEYNSVMPTGGSPPPPPLATPTAPKFPVWATAFPKNSPSTTFQYIRHENKAVIEIPSLSTACIQYGHFRRAAIQFSAGSSTIPFFAHFLAPTTLLIGVSIAERLQRPPLPSVYISCPCCQFLFTSLFRCFLLLPTHVSQSSLSFSLSPFFLQL